MRSKKVHNYMSGRNRGRGGNYQQNHGKPGVVYILENDAFPHLLKIGQSARSAAARVRELNDNCGTESPGRFRVLYECQTADCGRAEERVHGIFYDLRFRKEFFRVSFDEAKAAVDEACEYFNDIVKKMEAREAREREAKERELQAAAREASEALRRDQQRQEAEQKAAESRLSAKQHTETRVVSERRQARVLTEHEIAIAREDDDARREREARASAILRERMEERRAETGLTGPPRESEMYGGRTLHVSSELGFTYVPRDPQYVRSAIRLPELPDFLRSPILMVALVAAAAFILFAMVAVRIIGKDEGQPSELSSIPVNKSPDPVVMDISKYARSYRYPATAIDDEARLVEVISRENRLYFNYASTALGERLMEKELDLPLIKKNMRSTACSKDDLRELMARGAKVTYRLTRSDGRVIVTDIDCP